MLQQKQFDLNGCILVPKCVVDKKFKAVELKSQNSNYFNWIGPDFQVFIFPVTPRTPLPTGENFFQNEIFLEIMNVT